jgi:DNA helicase-2/ATP-dependent DNA helicase PcrA
MFKVDTPVGINDFSRDQLLDCIDDTYALKCGLHPKQIRYKLLEAIMSVLGYTITNDFMYALLTESESKLIVATAGSGKTTAVQLKIILDKLQKKDYNFQNVPRILFLNYNRHNVVPCKIKQDNMVKTVNMGIRGANVDSAIYSNTLHAFCKVWCEQYKEETGMGIQKQISDDAAYSLMSKVCESKSGQLNLRETPSPAMMLDLDNYRRECMLGFSEVLETSKFAASGLSEVIVKEILQKYNDMKLARAMYDYVDYFIKFVRLMENNREAREFAQGYYKYIVVDEIQDFTPLMYRVLSLAKGPDTRLVCIGDDDQTLYTFRGANVTTLLNFRDIFENTTIATLGTNLRCPTNIVTFSEEIILRNTLRFEKEIRGVRASGNIRYVGYDNHPKEVIQITRAIKSLSDKEQADTVVCYRERISSFALVDEFDRNGISYHIIKGFHKYDHELYRHLLELLGALRAYRVVERHGCLWKCLPLSREEWFRCVGYVRATGKFLSKAKHFSEHNCAEFYQRSGFYESMSKLVELSGKLCSDCLLTEVMPELMALLNKYYWNFKVLNSMNSAFEGRATTIIYNDFNTRMTLDEFRSDYEDKKIKFDSNQRNFKGVALSTLHSLKGLGFSNVHIMDLDDAIFPNYDSIDALNCTDMQKLELREEERRLFYVACTRSKKNLTMWYSKSNPSLFVKEYVQELESDGKVIVEDVKAIVLERNLDAIEMAVNKEDDLEKNIFIESDADVYLDTTESTEILDRVKIPGTVQSTRAFISSLVNKVGK